MAGPVKELISLTPGQVTPVTGVSGSPMPEASGSGSAGVKEETCRDCTAPLPFSVGHGHSENYPRDSYGQPGNILLSVDTAGPAGGAEEDAMEFPMTKSLMPTSKQNIG